MTRQFAMFLHVLTIMMQGINAVSALMKLGVFPPAWAPWIAVGLAGMQAAIGWIQNNFNPDGTPASIPYAPPVQ